MSYSICALPTLECAPCPPFFVDDVYELFINTTSMNQNLTADEIEVIRVRCEIDIPTTTTTTTTTSTTIPTTSTSTTKPPTTTTKLPATDTTTIDNTPDASSLNTSPTPNSTQESTFVPTLLSTAATSSANSINSSSTENPTSKIQSSGAVPSNVTSVPSPTNTTTTPINVTSVIVTDSSRSKAGTSVCHEVCVIGLITGAVCVLVIIAAVLSLIFRKSRSTEKRERGRSRSRNRFENMPNVELYDSVDVDDPSSNRNSGSSFIRRSGDFSRNPNVAFDNPAYRRSFELRPNRPSSSYWYDPDATNFEYSQSNAYLVSQKQNNPKGRSLSSSRIYDKNASGNQDDGNNVPRTSFREYVPKVFKNGGSDSYGSDMPYTLYSGQNGTIPNGIKQKSSSRRSLPRTGIDSNVTYTTDPLPRFKQSYRSRSFDPDLRGEALNRPEVNFSTMDNRHQGKRYSKHSTRNREDPRKKDRTAKCKSQKYTGNGAHVDRIHRSYSAGRTNQFQHTSNQSNQTYPNNCKDNRILSSNLQSVSSVSLQKDHVDSQHTNGRAQNRSPSLDNRLNNGNLYAISYRPNMTNNEVRMYQTKL